VRRAGATVPKATKLLVGREGFIGKIARPKNVWIVADMPKTRSGKIMRRVIASVCNFTDVGDVTTLANPEVVQQIRHHVQAEKLAHGEVPRELTEGAPCGFGDVANPGTGHRGRLRRSIRLI